MAQKWVSVVEACHILGISKSTLYRQIKQGEIESKKDGKATLCLITIPDESQKEESETQLGAQTETNEIQQLIEQLRKENEDLNQQKEYLKEQTQRKDDQIGNLQTQLEESHRDASEASQRHDTIVLQLTRQLENQQKLLEYHQEPWYRRWFRKREKDSEI